MNKLAIIVIILASISAIIVACGGSSTPTTEPVPGKTAIFESMQPTAAPAGSDTLADAVAAVPKKGETVGAGGVAPAAPAPVVGKLLSFDTDSANTFLVDAPAKFNESPWSAQLVAEGNLPPIEERLGDPFVLQVGEVGKYGGVLRRIQTSPLDIHAVGGRISARGMIRASGDGNSWVPMASRSWTPNEDGSVWTVKVPKGQKWSDGAPNTSEDYRYQYETYLNEDIVGRGTRYINQSGDPPLQVVAIDEDTVEFRYSAPNWLFEIQISYGHLPHDIPYYPAHYMKTYNANYNPDAQKIAEAAGFETWELYYFANRDKYHHNPNLPSLASYLFETNTTNEIVWFSRNHYFNMVDQEGNQLPYIDGMRIGPQVNGTDAVALAATQGGIDFQARSLSMLYFPLLKENEAKGDYKLKLVPDTAGTDLGLRWNLTFHGPERELIGNKDWRIAMSMAIDRDEINEVLYLGQGTPRNGLPSTDHAFYPGSEYERMYWTDIPGSNEILDRVMGPKDGEGFRTFPNGDRFELVITTREQGIAKDGAEMMCIDIEAVGVRCLIEPLGGFLRIQRNRASLHMARPAGHCCTGELYMFSGATIPTSRGSWAPEWGGWYRSGEGEEPPDWLKEIYTWFEAARTGPEEAVKSAKLIFESVTEQAVNPGIIGGIGSFAVLVVHNDLSGVPDVWGNRNGLQSPQNAFPERFFFNNAERRSELPKQFTHCPGCEPEVQEAGFGWAP